MGNCCNRDQSLPVSEQGRPRIKSLKKKIDYKPIDVESNPEEVPDDFFNQT